MLKACIDITYTKKQLEVQFIIIPVTVTFYPGILLYHIPCIQY
jgi:hypothetical protein